MDKVKDKQGIYRTGDENKPEEVPFIEEPQNKQTEKHTLRQE
jgi:hypothetical protein